MTPWPGGLEGRTLLSGGPPAPDLASEASPLPLGSTLERTIVPLTPAFYRVASDSAGKLTVAFRASGFSARVSLVDPQGRPLVQGDAPAEVALPSLIVEDVAAGVDYLEVEGLGGAGTFQLTANLTPAVPAFQTIPSTFTGASPIAVADFNGDGIPDLVAPDGIHLGVGDGTFQAPVLAVPITAPGSNATAIAVGDFNGDGLPDLAVAEQSADGNTADLRVLQDLGGGQFALVASFPVDPGPDALLAADMGDGRIDLAVASSSTGNLALFLGDGAGNFTPGPTLDVGVNPSAVVAGRFGDGHVDLVVADRGDPVTGQGQGLVVFQDVGADQFRVSATIAVGSGPSAMVAGDFQGDGHLDLAIADANSNDVSVLLGNGDGTFEAPRSYPVGDLPLALVAGDFRGNGHLDLATANANSGDVSVLPGNGDGTFGPQVRLGAGASPESLVSADFNGDRRPDLAVGDLGPGDISLLLGNGDGTFQDSLRNAVGDDPAAAVTADLNRDGRLDMVTVDTLSNEISVLLGDGDGTFQAARSFAAGSGPTSVAVGDFNGDGRLDLAVADSGDANGQGQGVSVLLGNGDGTFRAPIHFNAGTTPSAIVAGDFNGDGVLDLGVANSSSNDISILLGDGHGQFRTLPAIPLGGGSSGPVSLKVGDFGNGHLDLATANQGSDDVSILLGDGQGGFTSLAPVSLGGDPLVSPEAIAVGDFNGDGLPDLAVASVSFDGPDSVTILEGTGVGTFQPRPPIPLGTGKVPASIAAARLFGSGRLDLAVSDSNSGDVSLLEGDGQGGFQLLPPILLGDGGAPAAITAGDFNGDGMPDLAIGRQGPNNVAIELNQGGGQFADPSSVVLAPHDTPLVADIDGDGIPDVAVVDGAGNILLRRGDPAQPGRFEPPVTIHPGLPSRGIAVVATGQGPWLASIDATDSAVTLYSDRNGLVARAGTLPAGASPAQVVSADLEGHGQVDLVIRNAGDGTLTIDRLDGSGRFLTRVDIAVGPGISDLAVSDINQDGRPDLLLANQATGEVEVLLNQGDGSFGPPTLYRAGAGLSAVVGGDGSAPLSVTSRDATAGVASGAFTPGGPPSLVALDPGTETLGVLTGLGAGRFADPTPLPTSSPASSIRVADLNGDGIPDLAILGPAGVTVALADGRGGFGPPTTFGAGPNPTGLSIADVNGDGIPDLVVGDPSGDVLVLQGDGRGNFQPPSNTDRGLALAVANFGGAPPTLIYADQGLDRIVVAGPQSPATVLADRTTGLLNPRAVATADLNGDGIPDLIVANGGGNDVLVYPGLPGGGFGPALNGGQGSFTGTDPVSITVADVNGDHRPDLIVADQGSNDVAVLLNQAEGGGFTFVPGPRIATGAGPVSTLYADVNGDGIPDLVVSDSGSKDVMVIPGRGAGFFDDSHPVVWPVAQTPGRLYLGQFAAGPGPDVVTLDPGTGLVTMISGVWAATPSIGTFPSGGLDPVAGLAVAGLDGFDELVIANNGDGRVALLAGGPDGLSLAAVDQSLDLPHPTAVVLASVRGGQAEVYATSEGVVSAPLVAFFLGISSPPALPSAGLEGPGLSPSQATSGGLALTLLPLRDSALPLVATFLVAPIELTEAREGAGGTSGGVEGESASTAVTTVSLGQGPLASARGPASPRDPDEIVVSEEDSVVPQSSDLGGRDSSRSRNILGLDEAFEQFRGKTRARPLIDEPPPEGAGKAPLPAEQPGHQFAPGVGRPTRRADIVAVALDELAGEFASPPWPTACGARRSRIRFTESDSRVLTVLALSSLLGGPFASSPGRRPDEPRCRRTASPSSESS